MFVTKNKVVIDSDTQTEGVEYMSDSEANEYLRTIGHDPVYSSEGKVIAKSAHAITSEEQEVIQAQVVKMGKHRSKSLREVTDEQEGVTKTDAVKVKVKVKVANAVPTAIGATTIPTIQSNGTTVTTN